MRIERERPSQRRHHRLTAPICLTIGDRQIEVLNWSLGGILVKAFSEDWPAVGDEWLCYFTLPFQGFDIGFLAKAEVVRLDEERGAVAAKFTELGEREEELLTHFIEQLVRGVMVSTQDTIQRIDVPVTPISTKPDPNPTDQMPVRRWPIKTIAYTAFYAVIGLLVFGYLGLTLIGALTRIETDAAVVAGQTQVMTAPAEGRLSRLAVEPGQVISSGAVLAAFEDRDLEQAMVEAQAVLAQAEARYAEQKLLSKETRARKEGYDLIAENNIEQLKALIVSLERQREISKRRLSSIRDLVQKGWASQQVVDEAEVEFIRLESQIQRKRIHLTELETLKQSLGAVQLSSDARLIDESDIANAALLRAQKEVEAAQIHLDELRRIRSATQIRAPWDGRVQSVLRSQGADVRFGDDVLILQREGGLHVKVFLTQDQVEKVRVGSTVDLYLTSLDRWVQGTVSTIDRTDGFYDEVARDFTWRAWDSRTSLAMVQGEFPTEIAPGTPVIAILRKSMSSGPWRLLDSWWRGGMP